MILLNSDDILKTSRSSINMKHIHRSEVLCHKTYKCSSPIAMLVIADDVLISKLSINDMNTCICKVKHIFWLKELCYKTCFKCSFLIPLHFRLIFINQDFERLNKIVKVLWIFSLDNLIYHSIKCLFYLYSFLFNARNGYSFHYNVMNACKVMCTSRLSSLALKKCDKVESRPSLTSTLDTLGQGSIFHYKDSAEVRLSEDKSNDFVQSTAVLQIDNEFVNIDSKDTNPKDDFENKYTSGVREKSEKEIMKDLLSSKNIRIYPDVLQVFNVDGKSKHPSHLNGIPWDWLNEEKWRLHTFAKYPQNAAKSAILLAADGFAYMGSGKNLDDSVICFFCISVKNKWESSDDICEVHQQLSPVCPMVTKVNCSNVPMEIFQNSSLFGKVFPSSSKVKRNNPIYPESHDLEHDGEPRHMISTALTSVDVSKINEPSRVGINGHTFPTGISQPAQISIHTSVASSSTETNHLTTANDTERQTSSVHNFTTTSSSLTTSTTPATTSLTVSSSSSPPTTVVATAATVSSNATTVSSTVTTGQVSATASPSNLVSQTVGNSNQNAAKGNAGGPTYSELGIVTERPKRFEYAVLLKRMETFLSWPRDHHLRPKELAEAGFYYAGYGDCARCFYCGGGLRNWEDEDDVWVEHARWFPKCAYIRQQMGQVFVDTVQDLNKTNDHIPFKMVMDTIGDAASAFQLDSKDNPLKRDPAVKTIVDMGYPLAEVIATAETIKEDGNILSADKIFEKLVASNIKKSPNGIHVSEIKTDEAPTAVAKNLEKLRSLKEQNNQLRQQTICKICMDKEVAVVFLPCGHFVSCTDCAAAMKDCPVCRNHVKGIVRAFMG